MGLQIEYHDGDRYECGSLADLRIEQFPARGMAMLFYGGVALAFDDDEVTVAHRLRRMMTMGQSFTKDHYILITNKRRIALFPDGAVVSMPPISERNVWLNGIEMTRAEKEFYESHQSSRGLSDFPSSKLEKKNVISQIDEVVAVGGGKNAEEIVVDPNP